MSGTILRRVTLIPALLAVLLSGTAGAYSGVGNGAIQGNVVASTGEPLAGVSVVAVRTEEPPVIRSAVSDGMGNFFMRDMYVGTYTLGFSKFGFKTITTQSGDPQNRTALGDQVRTFVEPCRVAIVPGVTLFPGPNTSATTFNITVSDAATGQGVNEASVIVGVAAASGPGQDGRFTVLVPTAIDGQGNPAPVRALVQADGFEPQQTLVTPAPGGRQDVFIRLMPLRALLTGMVRLGYGIPASEITQVRILVENADSSVASGRVVDASGNFEVTVPASTFARARSFNLLFVLNGARVARLTNVLAPTGGARAIPGIVPIEPLTVTVVGQVLLSDGSIPRGSAFDQVVVLELGRAFPIVGGSFMAAGLPVGRAFTLQAQAQSPRTGRVELGRAQVTPISNGAAEPIFTVPLIVTSGGGGPFSQPF